MRRPQGAPRALTLLAALLAAYLLAPFAAGLAQLGLADWAGADAAGLARACAVSAGSATLATGLVALGGIPLGYLLARRPSRAMALLGFLVQLPLALPPLASGILLLFLLGYSSPLGRLTHGALTDTFAGIVLAEAFVAAPFLIIAARSGFASVDPVLEDVAATLGHRPGAVFRRVSLALSAPALWAGLLLCWLRAFGEFGATVMVAYHPYSLPVFTYIAFGSQGLPAMLPILLPTLAAAILVMAASQFAATPRPRGRIPAGALPPAGRPAAPPASARGRRSRLRLPPAPRRLHLDVAWQTSARRLAILGASGSGKSATLRLIAGLDGAETHQLAFAGRDLGALPPHARGLAYVPQTYGLLPHLPLDRQIRFGVNCDPAQARHWTARLGLAGLEHRRPAELSLGQQQRVALARALSRRSTLLLLDEPFSALDAPLRARLRDELLALQQEIATTTILVTHDPAEALLLADELLLLQDGHVLQSGPVEAVFQRPVSEAAARLLGALNIAAGHAIGPHRLDAGGVQLTTAGPALDRGPVGWSVRPSSVRITEAGHSARVLHLGDVRGGQRLARIQLGTAVLDATLDPGAAAALGPCQIQIDPAAIQVWPMPTTAAAAAAAARPLPPGPGPAPTA